MREYIIIIVLSLLSTVMLIGQCERKKLKKEESRKIVPGSIMIDTSFTITAGKDSGFDTLFVLLNRLDSSMSETEKEAEKLHNEILELRREVEKLK